MSHKIHDIVYNYPVKSKWGFNDEEIEDILTKFPTLNREKFDQAMIGNTGMIENDVFITYPVDLYHAIIAGTENRDLLPHEWD